MIGIALFCCGVAFVLYVLIGYPILLACYARVFPRPIHKENVCPAVSIIVPVRNGEKWIERKIGSLLASDYPAHLLNILVVSDGSTDGTEAIIHGWADPRVRLLALPAGGKATAVTQGLKQAVGEIIVLTDVRQEFDPQAIPRLVACFGDPTVGVVTGELFIRKGTSLEEQHTGLYWQYEKWIRRNLNRIDAMLGATGSIYAIRRELQAPIPSDVLLDDVYLPFAIAFQGYRIYFEDGAKAFDFPTSLESEFWRKVRTQAGVYQIARDFPALLWPANRRFLHFASHKLGRLMLPFALLTIVASSFALPRPFDWLALLSQAAFYGAALLDVAIPEGSTLKRLTSVVRTFVVLVAAAGCAVVVFFRPADTLWRPTKVGQASRSETAESSSVLH